MSIMITTHTKMKLKYVIRIHKNLNEILQYIVHYTVGHINYETTKKNKNIIIPDSPGAARAIRYELRWEIFLQSIIKIQIDLLIWITIF